MDDATEASARAPIEIDVAVPCPPARAFDYFTCDIGRWWPLARYSCSEDASAGVAFEPHAGGGLIEIAPDGTRHRWGTVTTWAPGERIAFSWHPARDEATAQWVEVTFRSTSAGTRVTLRHGGFERLGERASAAREAYRNGWPSVLGDIYRRYCERRNEEEKR